LVEAGFFWSKITNILFKFARDWSKPPRRKMLVYYNHYCGKLTGKKDDELSKCDLEQCFVAQS